ncbi:MAG: GMC family oxidoreductase N-terminal domain-containing protein [Anaerolineales bacterium]
MENFLTAAERRTLESVCQTLIPSLTDAGTLPAPLARLGAEEVGLASLVEDAIPEIAGSQDQRQLRLFLRLLGSPWVNGLLSGEWSSFSELGLEARTEVLRDWMMSRFGLRRAAFQGLKRLALFLFYAEASSDVPNPVWEAIGYDAPGLITPQASSPLNVRSAVSEDQLSAEVLVVGSGAGGSVVAAALADAGHEVLIVEKGGDESHEDIEGLELAGNSALFERRGGLTTSDLGMVVLAGSTLGGGTVVNWSTSLPTPDFVRREWATDFGFEGLEGAEYERCLEAVSEALDIDIEESEANAQNQVLARGGEALGYRVEPIPRNVRGCVDCTYCGFGCRYGAKQSTRQTYLRKAQRAGARILVRAEVERLILEGGRATGAVLNLGRDEKLTEVEVTAKAVVLSAGAIHTPAVMLRSGLRHPHLGRNIHLHPVTAPVGVFDEPIRSWQGPPQTRMIGDLADLDGRGHGVRLEVAPAHPGLWASALPWTSGRGHKVLMAQVDHLANIIVLTRDKGKGQVRLDADGNPRLDYRLDRYDASHLLRGTEAALRIFRRAGARRIISPHSAPEVFDAEGHKAFEDYLERTLSRPIRPNDLGLFSAHQMGSCRIAGSRSQGVVRPDGETWDVRNLFVADASIFPSASGVNPMVTIMACAELLSERIMAGIKDD